jgi:predicted esterase
VSRAGLAVAALLLAAGCGGHGGTATSKDEVVEGPLGKGGYQTWIFRPHEYPKAVVVFVHGDLDRTETTPAHHREWIDHLVAKRDAVIYPRYETDAGKPAVLRDLLIGVGIGLRRLGVRNVPLVVVGYSRGGSLAVDYAAAAGLIHAKPAAVLAVYPAARAPFEFPVDYRQVDRRSRIRILVGDRDRVVGRAGARQLISDLRDARFPVARIDYREVRSHGSFSATHASVFESGEDAQKAYWAEADDLVEQVTG